MMRRATCAGLILILLLPTFLSAQTKQRMFAIEKFSQHSFQLVFASTHKSANLNQQPIISTTTESWTGSDKIEHFLGSAMLASSSFLALKVTRNDINQSAVSSLGITCSLGIIKEIYDLYHPQNQQASLKDLTADFIGAICGTLLARSF